MTSGAAGERGVLKAVSGRRTKALLAAIALSALIAVTGCGSGSDSGSAKAGSSPKSTKASPGAEAEESAGADSEESPSEPVVIEIKDFKFAGPKTVAPGATVEVKNADRSSHSVTSEDDAFKEVIVEGGGDTGTFKAPTEPGTYAYVCKFHPEMKATLVVE